MWNAPVTTTRMAVMIAVWALIVSAVILLAGCNVTLDRAPVVTVVPPEFYTRYEVDAINAENACRQLARTLLQAQRCTVRLAR